MNDCSEVLREYSKDEGYYAWINIFLLSDKDEKKFLDMYTTAGRTHGVPSVAQKALDRVKNYIENLDNCFSKSERTTDDTMVLYRGVKKNLLKMGESITLKNFTSTSKFLEKAQFFVNDSGCCLYRMTIDKDIPYIDMEKYSISPEESEVLLPRDLIMTYENDMTITLPYPYGIKKVKNVKITRKKDDIIEEPEILPIPLSPEPPSEDKTEGKSKKKKQTKKTRKSRNKENSKKSKQRNKKIIKIIKKKIS